MPAAWLHREGVYGAKGLDPATGKRKSYYGSSAEEASYKAWLSLAPPAVPEETLYGYYRNAYLPTIAKRSQAWQDQVGWAMDGYIIPELGDMPIEKIRRKELQRLFNKLQAMPRLSLSSVAKIKIVLSGVLNLAEADEVIVRNFCRHVRVESAPAPDKKALTFAECKRLIDGSHDLVRPFVLLGLCGLRRGEALGVTRSHMLGQEIQVRQQILQPQGGCVIKPKLKTPQSRRDIPIPDGLKAAILGCNQVSGIWVCSDTIGGYLTPKNADRELKIALKAAKFDPTYISPHELRHTFISLLENELEIPPAIVAALSGKRDERHASDYSHSHRAQLERAMERYWSEIQKVRSVSHVREA